MRRRDREVIGLENILSILNKCDVIRIGLCANNIPYIVPMNFAYEVMDEKVFLYFHCAPQGKKLEILAQNNQVCFEADCSFKTQEAETACAWSSEFESVMGEGEITILQDEVQKINALDAIMKRYGFQGKPQYKPEELARVVALQICVNSITGKQKLKKV